MAQYLMSDYLSAETPDYAWTLDIVPDEKVSILPIKNQKMLFSDKNKPVVLDISDASVYLVTLRWHRLIFSGSKIIMDLYDDPAKAKGLKRSFRWENPDDSGIYVANFRTAPHLARYSGNYHEIDSVTLLVWGKHVS